ncbi:MAG: aspartate carbamoyltransferase [Fervidicoccaceae archaeon]|jgi:aspartate carbamoyltransferase catalytic subunit|uniref:Aspartate carbamoyltransferase n=1 Tax=Fervidicoccus fontis TaxID=683846 RepID=A0A7C2YZV7_9CREN|nr:MAG: aspartate carbamoyltransferase [Fervidicoccus sp.]HEU97973.1 aspartate carbamoyltransferase [Fervidicoccus fontis]
MKDLKGKDILSAFDFDRETLEHLFTEADELRKKLSEGKIKLADGKIMATVFLEPSTRTKISFQMAMVKLGGSIIDFQPESSSLQKGESDLDTIKIIDGYSPDLIVLRQSKPYFPHSIKDKIETPIINGGDGTNEHPTQALLDLYTIWRELGRIDGLKIGIMGDLKYGRTAPSLSYMLTFFKGVKVYYISPKELRLRDEVKNKINGKIIYEEMERLEEIEDELDVLYVTRLQKERFSDPTEYERLKSSYIVTQDSLKKLKKIPIIMHPLPRVWELPEEIDSLPQAKYFEQAKNGMFVRAALIKEILGL